MFTVQIDTAELLSRLKQAGQNIDDPATNEAVLNDVGVYLMGEVQLNFETLSRGGTGIDGRAWKELAPETEWKKAKRNRTGPKSKKAAAKKGIQNPPKSQIGVDTGRLRNSAFPGRTGNVLTVNTRDLEVTIGFGVSHAEHFHRVRPLVPDKVPLDWVAGCERMVAAWLADVLKPLTDGE